MAIARLSMKVGGTGKAGPHAAYIAREGRYAAVLETGERLEATEHGNMPAWAASAPQEFWRVADVSERKNGTTYREMEIALPRELDAGQRLALVRAFVAQELGERHAYQWAIHNPRAADGLEQPHAHIMFSERQVDGIARDPEQYFRRYNAKAPERGGARKGFGPHAGQTLSTAERAADLKALRGRWEDLANRHLERAGALERIDMRSHAERKSGLLPEAKQLPSQWRGAGRSNVIEFRAARQEVVRAAVQVKREVPQIFGAILDLGKERFRRGYEANSARVAQAAREEAQAKARQAQEAQARRAQQEQEKEQEKEQQRIQRMTSAELGVEIERIRPWANTLLVSRDESVERAKKAAQLLDGQERQVAAKGAQARFEADYWRKSHPLRARMHDSGLLKAKFLSQREEAQEATAQELEQLRPRLHQAAKEFAQLKQEVTARVESEQAPLQKRVEEFERTQQRKAIEEQRKAAEERTVRQQVQAVDQVLQAFREVAALRQRQAYGYADDGRQWNALPDDLRRQVNNYNRLKPADQPKAAEAMRQILLRDPPTLEKMGRELEIGRKQERNREQDRGMSR